MVMQELLLTKCMKIKMGRPKLPKGQAKPVLIAARFSTDEGIKIHAAIKASGKSKPEWVRASLLKMVDENKI